MDRNLKPNRLSIAHWNAGGIGNKIHEVPTFLQKYNVDILIVGETWFNKNSKSKMPGYKCFRRDREIAKKPLVEWPYMLKIAYHALKFQLIM